MPNRIIREGINSSPRVNQLSPGAEILYRRLLLVADDYGRYYASPVTVRGGCWPTHPSPPCEQDVSNWLTECQQPASNLLTCYEVNGCKYLQVIDFNQKIRSKSRFPEPASRLSADCQQIVDNLPALGVIRSSSVEGDMRIANGVPKLPHRNPDAPSYESVNASWKWYMAEYPKEVFPHSELQLFMSVMERPQDLDDLQSNLPAYKRSKQWQDGFAPSSENFLTKRMFNVKPKGDSASVKAEPRLMFK